MGRSFLPRTRLRMRFPGTVGCLGLAALLGGSALAADEVRVPTVLERVRTDVEEAPLALRFQGTTPEEFARWHAAFGERLRALLGPYAPPRQWKTVVRGS